MTTVLLFVLTAVLLPLLLTEFGDWCPWVAARLVRWSARRLGSPAVCARYEEEWTANLNEVPGKLSRLAAALGYLACVPRMRWVLRRGDRVRAAALPSLTSSLPPVIGSFVGRWEELDQLTGVLRDGDRRVAILGRPGVGKTQLAAQVAYLMRDHFKDGCVWLRCWGSRSLHQELRDHLALWGVLPSGGTLSRERHLVKLFAAMVSNRRTLVVFDDVEGFHQIQKVLSCLSNCTVIVTMRGRLDLLAVEGIKALNLGGIEFELGPMAPSEAEELMRQLIGADRFAAEQDSVRSLIALCGGSPLVLAIAAALCRDNRPIAEAVRRMRETSSGTTTEMRDPAIRRSIDQAVRLVSPNARQLFRRLSLLAVDTFETREAAVVVDQPGPSIDELLDELVRAGLLQQAGTPSRYRLHDLLRVYACETLHNEEQPEEIDHLTSKLDAMPDG